MNKIDMTIPGMITYINTFQDQAWIYYPQE